MKRFLATILSIFYLALSSSAAISIHYCGGELESININSLPVSCCCGNMEMSNSCCHDKELNLELDIDQQIISISNIVPQNVFFIAEFTFGIDILQEVENEEVLVKNYNIPPPKLTPIWLTNCSLTYYG